MEAVELTDQFGMWGHTAVLREGCGRWYDLWGEALESWVGSGNFEVALWGHTAVPREGYGRW